MKALLTALREGRLIELPEADKRRSLEYLAHLIEAVPDLAGSPDLGEAVLAREAALNTGIGLGVACPHVRASGAGELLCAVGWTPVGIDYGARDAGKVHLVVMYYIPDAQKGTYLKEVSQLAAAVQKQGGIQSIATADDLSDVRDQLLDWVTAAVEAGAPEARARMIRLEAKTAVADGAPMAGAPGQIVSLTLVGWDDKLLALAQSPELVEALEKDAELPAIVKQRLSFERAGWRLIYRSAATFAPNRVL
ncbi:MAG: PTS sugar transporter subunit IIA, partial [Elusimicrobia bacterium]|nr:PTS sugar transporter subunit IIA [Elusimicrobiota bacterium]